MTLTPNFLPVGSIVEYNYKNELGKMPVVVYGIHPPTPQKDTRLDGKWLVDIWVDGTTYITTPIDDISPIPLTPEILTEWCSFKKVEENQYRLGFKLLVNRDGKWFDYGSNVQIDYLHELQLLFAAHKTVLPITIK